MVLTRYLALAALVSTSLSCSGLSGSQDGGVCTACDAGKPAKCAVPEAGAVSLTRLSVTSKTGSSLVPAFSPGTYDYYVQCAAGVNELTVSMTASSGAKASISIETPGGSLHPVTGSSLSVNEGQAIVVTATAGEASREYWVRCVPHDFPEMQWTTHETGCTRPPGYYLIGTMSLPPNKGPYAIVLDVHGVPVWYRYNAQGGVYDVETLTPGAISFAPYWQVDHLAGSTTLPVVEPYDEGGPLGSPDPHELRILPNGHYLALQSPGIHGVDLTGLSLPLPGGGVGMHGKNETILACEVQEFDSTGKVWWEWTATDHFDPVQVMVLKGNGELGAEGCTDGPGSLGCYVEPFHCNSIDVDTSNGDANNGNLLIAARHMNSVFYVEKKTGTVLWKMGGADSSKDNAVYVRPDDPFVGMHDARFQPDWRQTCSGWSGQISLFDDETDTMNPARGAVYDVRVDRGGSACAEAGAGGATGATLRWQYKNSLDGGTTSNTCGSFRITPDGSRIIDWGQSEPTPNGLVFTEVDEKGNDLLDLICPDLSSSYRAVKVPLSAFDLDLLRRAAGQ